VARQERNRERGEWRNDPRRHPGRSGQIGLGRRLSSQQALYLPPGVVVVAVTVASDVCVIEDVWFPLAWIPLLTA
jgi:hypothetical protein